MQWDDNLPWKDTKYHIKTPSKTTLHHTIGAVKSQPAAHKTRTRCTWWRFRQTVGYWILHNSFIRVWAYKKSLYSAKATIFLGLSMGKHMLFWYLSYMLKNLLWTTKLTYLAGLKCCLVWAVIYPLSLCMRRIKALMRLRVSAGSSEPLHLAVAISAEITMLARIS